ncbi:DUF6622 family protein [Undibacterium cyanobacteriorum]
MFTQIVSNTPTWVWILLAGLVALGYSQTKNRSVKFKRSLVLPIVMLGLSSNSMLQSFGNQTGVLIAWLASLILLSVVVSKSKVTQNGVKYDGVTDRLELQGSWLPMVLIMAIFVGKYAISVMKHANPSLFEQTSFGVACALYFALLSSYFLGRSLASLKHRKNHLDQLHLTIA